MLYTSEDIAFQETFIALYNVSYKNWYVRKENLLTVVDKYNLFCISVKITHTFRVRNNNVKLILWR